MNICFCVWLALDYNTFPTTHPPPSLPPPSFFSPYACFTPSPLNRRLFCWNWLTSCGSWVGYCTCLPERFSTRLTEESINSAGLYSESLIGALEGVCGHLVELRLTFNKDAGLRAEFKIASTDWLLPNVVVPPDYRWGLYGKWPMFMGVGLRVARSAALAVKQEVGFGGIWFVLTETVS